MIDLDFEKVLSPTRKSWKENMYQSKLFAFITSGWLAVAVISVLLAIVYVLIKIPKEPQVAEPTPVIVPEVATPKPVKPKPATNKVAAKAIYTTALPVAEIHVTEQETQFDRDLTNFERQIP